MTGGSALHPNSFPRPATAKGEPQTRGVNPVRQREKFNVVSGDSRVPKTGRQVLSETLQRNRFAFAATRIVRGKLKLIARVKSICGERLIEHDAAGERYGYSGEKFVGLDE